MPPPPLPAGFELEQAPTRRRAPALPPGFELEGSNDGQMTVAEPSLWASIMGSQDPQTGEGTPGILPSIGQSLRDWGPTIESLPGDVAASLAAGISGMRASELAALEQPGAPALSPQFDGMTPEQVAAARRQATEGELAIGAEARADVAPLPGENLAQRSLRTAATSLAASAPGMAVGLLSRNPTAAAATMYPSTAGQKFGELASFYDDEAPDRSDEQRLADLERAQTHASTQGIIEVGTEIAPFGAFLKAGSPYAKRLAEILLAELPGESIASITQSIDDALAMSPEGGTSEEVLEGIVAGVESLPETWLATIAGGGAQAMVASLAGGGADAEVEAPGLEQMLGDTIAPAQAALPAPQPIAVDPAGVARTPGQAVEEAELADQIGLSPDVVSNLDRLRARKEAAIADTAPPAMLAAPDAAIYVDQQGAAGGRGQIMEYLQASQDAITAARAERAAMGLTPDVDANLTRLEQRRTASRAQPLALPAPDPTVYVDEAGQAGTTPQREAYARQGNEEARAAADEAAAMGFTPDVAYALEQRQARELEQSAGLGDMIAAAGPQRGKSTVDLPAAAPPVPAGFEVESDPAQTRVPAQTGERRVNEKRRRRVAEMTSDELRGELMTHEVTKIPNRRAYEEAEKLPVQVSVDANSLKFVNDEGGHEAGDHVLRAIATALREESDQSYHFGGDEFVVQASTPEEAEAIIGRARDRLSAATVELVGPDGRKLTLNGIGIAHGAGKTLDEADRQLQQEKTRQERQGLRAARGEKPPGTTVTAAEEGIQSNESDAAATDEELAGRESAADRLSIAAELFGDLDTAQSIAEHGFDALDVEQQRAVVSTVRGAIENEQIVGDVLESLPVDVVNMLVGRKGSADDRSASDPSVLAHRLAVPADGPVPRRVRRVVEAMAKAVTTVESSGAATVAEEDAGGGRATLAPNKRRGAVAARDDDAVDAEEGGAADVIAEGASELPSLERTPGKRRAAGGARDDGHDETVAPEDVETNDDDVKSKDTKSGFRTLAERAEQQRKKRANPRGWESAESNAADEAEISAAIAAVYAGDKNAPTVEFVAGAMPDDMQGRIQKSPGRTWAAAFDPVTGRVFINTHVVTNVDDAVWNAAHEIDGHLGLRGLAANGERGVNARNAIDKVLERAKQNPTVDKLAGVIGQQRKALKGLAPVEEALSELAAAARTGNYDRIKNRYGVEVPTAARKTLKGAIARVVDRLKQIFAKAGAKFTDAQVYKLLEGARRYVRSGKPSPRAPKGTKAELAEAFHGSPHKFDDFKLDFIGSGEGAAAYGWGLYFAQNPKTAEMYAEQLSDVDMKNVSIGTITLYKNGTPFDYGIEQSKPIARALGWSKPTSTQLEAIALLQENFFISEWQWREAYREGGVSAVQKKLRAQMKAAAQFVDDDAATKPVLEEIAKRSADEKIKVEVDHNKFVYTVDVDDAAIEQMLEWDTPVGQQPRILKIVNEELGLTEGTVDYWQAAIQDEYDNLEDSPGSYSRDYIEGLVDEWVSYSGYGERGMRVEDELKEIAPEMSAEFFDVVERQGLGGMDEQADTGEQLYHRLVNALGSEEKASQKLLEAGVPGITYWDAGSRDAKEGTKNYVVFDASIVRVKSVNGDKISKAESDQIIENTEAEEDVDLNETDTERRSTKRRTKPRPGGRRAQEFSKLPSKKGDRGYTALAQKAIDAWNKKVGWRYGALGRLPSKRPYLEARYLALGRVGAAQEVGRSLYDALRPANAADSAAVYAYMTNRGGDPSTIEDAAVRRAAIKTKTLIDDVGKKLVELGLLSKTAYEEHAGEYLPRLYLKHMLGDNNMLALGNGKRLSDLGYLKQRQEIPEEVRKVILGEITDPAFLASFGVTRTLRDIALVDFLQAIAGNEAWVPKGSTVEWNGRNVSPFWLADEARALRKRARLYKDPEKEKAIKLVDAMEAAVDAATEELGKVDTREYAQIPNSARYGALKGLWVRKEIFDDLVGAQGFIPREASAAESLLGQGGVLTKATQWWKMSKVVLNPPTQVRNFLSNLVLLNLSGVPARRIFSGELLGKAINSIAKKDRYYQIAAKYGLFSTTFANQEGARLRDEWLALQDLDGSGMAKIRAFAGKVINKASDAYALTEAVGKIMKLRDGMDREGKSAADAMLAAHEALFDYSLVPRSVQYLRNQPLGAPFITFMYKALGKLAETAVKHPMRFAPYAAIPYLLAELIKNAYDVDDDDLEKLRNAFPAWMRERGHMLLLPYKDDRDRWQVVDLGYLVPWGAFADWAAAAREGKGAKELMNFALFAGPLTDVTAALETNVDPFTGKEIINKSDPPALKFQALMQYIWNLAMPGFVTESGALNQFKKSLKGNVNRRGEPGQTPAQAAMRLFGINVYPVDPEATRAANLRGMRFEMDEARARGRELLRDRNLTAAERKEISETWATILKEKALQIQQYESDTQINPKLRTGAGDVDEE